MAYSKPKAEEHGKMKEQIHGMVKHMKMSYGDSAAGGHGGLAKKLATRKKKSSY